MADWREDLGASLNRAEAQKVETRGSELGRFVADVVVPAFEQIRLELERHGRQVTIRHAATSAALLVTSGGEEEMTYRVQGRMFPIGVVPFAEVRSRERKGLRLLRSENMFRSGKPDYTLRDVTSDEIIQNFLEHYRKRVLNE
ncbi:MAG: hypothetical protein K8T26_01815 [Lentisphaerae bacterium]|nr:hypothetical protein [Lentisphaerota bacterium]